MRNADVDVTSPKTPPVLGEISVALKRSIIQHYLRLIEELMKNPNKDSLLDQANFLGTQIVTRTLGWLRYEKLDGNSLTYLGYISGILLRQMDYLNSQPQVVAIPVVVPAPENASTMLQNFLEEVRSCGGSVHLDTIVQRMRTKFGSILTFPRILSSETFKERQAKVVAYLEEQLKLDEKNNAPAIIATTPVQSAPVEIAKRNTPEEMIKFFQDQIVKLVSFTEARQSKQLAIDLQKELGPKYDVPQLQKNSDYAKFHVALNDYFKRSITRLQEDNGILPPAPERHTILRTFIDQRPSFNADTFSLEVWIKDVKTKIGYWADIPSLGIGEHTRNYYIRIINHLKAKRDSIGQEWESAVKIPSAEKQPGILRAIINTAPNMKSRPEDLIYWINGVRMQLGNWCVLPIADPTEEAAAFCQRVIECLTKKLAQSQNSVIAHSSPDESRLDVLLEIYRSAPSALATTEDRAVWNQRVLERNTLALNIQKHDTPQDTFRAIMTAVSAELKQVSLKVKEAKIKTLSGILESMPCVTMDESVLLEGMNSVRKELSLWVLLPKYNPSRTVLQNYSDFRNAVTQTLNNLKR